AAPQARAQAAPRILAFSKTGGFKHTSIPAALDAIDTLGQQNGFTVDRSENAGDFTTTNLAKYDAVVFVSTTGELLNGTQQTAFQQYIRAGGGYAGVHAAADAEYNWAWYGDLVGAFFDRHPAQQQATIKVEDRSHPSTAHLGATWRRTDEWYDFRSNPRNDVKVLMTVDENSYNGGEMGADHPIAWYHEFDGGRSWYTGLGHTAESYAEPNMLKHLLGGIQYAIGQPSGTGGKQLSRTGWQASASLQGASAAQAIDGNIATRWSTGTPMRSGMYYQLDLGASKTFSRIRLRLNDSQPNDYPRSYAVYASNNSSSFGTPIATGNGSRTTDITVPTKTARYVRVVQTGSDPQRYWSIYEMDLFAP
ncbi:MAG: ThuA domain-containing protein, partial [Dermatophilaceae bacterium]